MKTEEEQKGMSDTPETNAACWERQFDGTECVDAEFARKLERERDEAIIKYTGQANEFETHRNIALSKLEEAWKEIKIWQIENLDLGIENRDLRGDCEHFVNKIKEGVANEIRLERERDEARRERDEALALANSMHEKWLAKGRCCETLADELREVKQERDEALAALRELWQSADAFLPNFDAETIARWRKAAGWEDEE